MSAKEISGGIGGRTHLKFEFARLQRTALSITASRGNRDAQARSDQSEVVRRRAREIIGVEGGVRIARVWITKLMR